MPIRTIIFAAILNLCALTAHAQEINATVHVDRSQINDASLTYLDTFGDQLESYLNDYSWTDDEFQPQEEINVSIQINFLSATDNRRFSAIIIIRSMRPIYHSTQQTPVFLYKDKNWKFTYKPNQGLVHDNLQFDEIATLLDFYAYVIIGYDYDTFSPLGGTPYFSEAQNLVSRAQQSNSAGWDRSSTRPRSRAQLITDLLNPNYENLRQASYLYHRKGLDMFLENPEKARKNMIKALTLIQQAKRQTTNNLLFNTFFDAKSQEINAIFKDASTQVRLKAYNLLADIDQAHLNDYSDLQS